MGTNSCSAHRIVPLHHFFCREWKKRRLSKVHQHWGGMEFLNSVLPKTRAPSSYTRLWHTPSRSQTTNCTRFLTLTDPFAPLSRENYSDFLCSKLSSHSPLGHFFSYHWKFFRVPTCELFESELLDSFFWTKTGATRHPSYSTSTPLGKNSFVDCGLSTVISSCWVPSVPTRKTTGTMFTQPSFLFTKSLCGVAKLGVFFFLFLFFMAEPVDPTVTISQWTLRSEASFLWGKWEGYPSNWFDCLKIAGYPSFSKKWNIQNNLSLWISQCGNWIWGLWTTTNTLFFDYFRTAL